MNRDQIRARLTQLAELRKQRQAHVEGLLQASFGEGRAQTDDEQTAILEARSEVARIDIEVVNLKAADDELRKAEDEAAATHPTIVEGRADAAEGEGRGDAAAVARARGSVRVGREPRTYERHDIRSSYLIDLARSQLNHGADIDGARSRLERHAAEVRVDLPRIEARIAAERGGYANEVRSDGDRGPVEIRYEQEQRALTRTDGAGGEFVPPLWMMEDWIGVARASRIVADQCLMMPLPAGTDSISIPKVATGATTAIQTADNAAVSSTDMTSTSVTAGVKTIAGQQDIAMQLLDQSPISFDQIVFMDLGEDHAVATDVQVISGSNASGQVRGIRTIASVDTTAYTDASPTVAELYPKLADSANQVATNRKRPVTHIFMHPRRWYWMLAAVDASSRPLVSMQAQGPQNALAAAFDGNPYAEGGPVGVTPFGTVYLDSNIPTTLGGGTEDVIILGRPSEYYLWESPVRTRVLQEVLSANLTVRFQLFNYMAFMPDRRAENTSLVGGTGLAAPTF